MPKQNHSTANVVRLLRQPATFLAIGGGAAILGLIAFSFGHAPSYVPFSGAAIMAACYAVAGALLLRNS